MTKLLCKLSKLFSKLHAKRIVHRDVCAQNISVKLPKTRPADDAFFREDKVIPIKLQIINFELAFCFKKESQEVTQGFNIANRNFAPEIEHRSSHGTPADVWGLGKLFNDLMALLPIGESASASEPSERCNLQQLIDKMVQDDQSARPSMQQIFQQTTELLAKAKITDQQTLP